MTASANKNKAAEAAALLKKQIDENQVVLKAKEELLAALPETASEEEKAKIITEIEEVKAVLDSLSGSKKSSKNVKVKALVNLSGIYKLAWSAGQVFEIDEKQANELVEAKAVELVKK